jgi:hypothetical protein
MKTIVLLLLLVIPYYRATAQQNNLPKNSLWISLDYTHALDEYKSITKADSVFKHFLSLSVSAKGELSGIDAEMFEASLLNPEKYVIKRFSGDTLEIVIEDKINTFIRLDSKQSFSASDGRKYLYAYLFLNGSYLGALNTSEKELLKFKPDNTIKGSLNYTKFYPSSYVGKDIILLQDNNNEILNCIFEFKTRGILLKEIEPFEWGCQALTETGKTFFLKHRK